MGIITTVIIDDMQIHIDALRKLLDENFPEISIAGTASEVGSAVELIQNIKPELVFMDVELGSLYGFDVLHRLNHRNFEVIFITAFNKYAEQAFRESAIDYLTKPIRPDYLNAAITKVKERIQLREKAAKAEADNRLIENMLRNFQVNPKEKKIALTNRESTFLVVYDDIIRLGSDNAKTIFYIYKKDGKHGEYNTIEVSGGIGLYEDLLRDIGFFYRVHNEHIINVHHINKFEKGESAAVVMHGVPSKFVPISKSRLKGFIEFMKTLGTYL